jgi:hypothetical protein
MTFENWLEDVDVLAGWLNSRSPKTPVILHGLEMGALLAAKTFESGVGDALLMWAAPTSANQALRGSLLHRISMDHAFKFGDERKPVSEYLRQIEGGSALEVDGYRWSPRLWLDSFRFELPAGLGDEGKIAQYDRPVRSVKLDKRAAPLFRGSSVGYEAIHRDFSKLFAENFEWMMAHLAVPAGGDFERSH